MKVIKFPQHTSDFTTRIPLDGKMFSIRMRWSPISSRWFLNIRNQHDKDVGIPVPLPDGVPIFQSIEENGRVISCMARPDGLPDGISLLLINNYELNEDSFNDATAKLVILQ